MPSLVLLSFKTSPAVIVSSSRFNSDHKGRLRCSQVHVKAAGLWPPTALLSLDVIMSTGWASAVVQGQNRCHRDPASSVSLSATATSYGFIKLPFFLYKRHICVGFWLDEICANVMMSYRLEKCLPTRRYFCCCQGVRGEIVKQLNSFDKTETIHTLIVCKKYRCCFQACWQANKGN